MRVKVLVACVFSVFLMGLMFPANCAPKGNKEIATQFMHDLLEGNDPNPLVSQYCDPNIQIEFPEGFAMPHHGDHHIMGVKELLHGLSAWRKETAHKVEIVNVVGEGNLAAVLARTTRVFKMEGKEKIYKDHIYGAFFEFNNGKIKKLTVIFDVLKEVEQQKAKIYSGHKCRQ